MSMNRYLRQVIHVLMSLVFPPHKDELLYRRLSPQTLSAHAVRTYTTGYPRTLAPLPYSDELVRKVIHTTKYYGSARGAELLGQVLGPFIAEELAERRMFGSFSTTLLVPVPLHPRRERERGYNQADRIAQALVAYLHDKKIRCAPHALERTRYTKPQARQKDRAKRKTNMVHTFSVPDATLVAGKDVVLLDDVVTTGTTLLAARDALIRAGAREVLLVAAAH